MHHRIAILHYACAEIGGYFNQMFSAPRTDMDKMAHYGAHPLC